MIGDNMNKLELIKGSCLEEVVDTIVNAANRNLISGGGICGGIYKKAGYEELNAACRKITTPLKDGEAVITPAFNITNAKYIIHAVGPDFNKTPNAFYELYNAYYNSLELLKEKNLHSISFPLISSGIFGYSLEKPAEESAKQCIRAYNEFIKNNKDYDINVLLCAYSEEEYEQIKKYFT